MKIIVFILALLLTQFSMAQAPIPDAPSSMPSVPSDKIETSKTVLTIPAGTSIPLTLKQAISTKTARSGDPVYAETAFPFVLNEKVVIPAGTYIQGKIERVQRGGHVKGRAEVLIHFTSMIYPNGYTVMLGGSIENTPGAENTSMKDSEGTIRQDSEAGKKAESAAGGAIAGATIGGVTNGLKGAGIGAGVGGAAGLAVGMLSRGADVRLEPGTSIQMEIQREVTVDASRVSSREVVIKNQ
jgi:hypothetical protein